MEDERLKILLHSLYKYVKEGTRVSEEDLNKLKILTCGMGFDKLKEKRKSYVKREMVKLSKEELNILTQGMGFDSLKKEREHYVKRQMVNLGLTEYSEENPRWEELLYSSPIDKAIEESFAYFEDGKIKVQFGGYGMEKSLLVIMEQRDLGNRCKRMHYDIFHKNPLNGIWMNNFWEKSVEELTKSFLEKRKLS